MYADISVVSFNHAKNQIFTYLVSDHKVEIGLIVEIPFARKTSFGVIRKIHNNRPSAVKKLLTITRVLPHQPIPKHLLDLADWLIDYYVAAASSVWQLMLPKNPLTKPRKKFTEVDSLPKKLARLTPAQNKTLKTIEASSKPVLLEGVMGSGKTELYFYLIHAQLQANKSALLLMPEIFLTTQMIDRAQKHFGSQFLITHSGLTLAQRRAVWDRCNTGEPVVVLGPRSALFCPLHNLGVIIIDECHEQSYKQNSSPRYLTEHVAGKLAKLHRAKLVLGSATPSITTRYLADVGKITHTKLSERAISSPHPEIEITDIPNNNIFTQQLLALIEANIKNKKLTMLYLNRRGTAPVFMCQDCGYSPICPKCGSSLHLHADLAKLKCHICNFKTLPPARCPKCHNNNLRGVGVGTKALETKLAQLFPQAKIARIDRDNAKRNYMQDTMQSIKKNKIDILIGTQMIGRGIDIENLNLVGVINADYDLGVIDYNSRERAFQLISQTGGRAGRRNDRGKVIIQTKQPNNPFFNSIKANNYEEFYRDELVLRKQYSYPPYVYLLKLECGYKDPTLGERKCQQLIDRIIASYGFNCLGPTTSYPAIVQRKYFWQIIVKSKDRHKLVEIAKSLEPSWKINLDPFGII